MLLEDSGEDPARISKGSQEALRRAFVVLRDSAMLFNELLEGRTGGTGIFAFPPSFLGFSRLPFFFQHCGLLPDPTSNEGA